MSEEGEYQLLMPFLPVASNGGPFDDQAYTAGFEMGSLWEALDVEIASGLGVITEKRTIRRENLGQADLIAMHRGWRIVEVVDTDDGEWTTLTMTKTNVVSS